MTRRTYIPNNRYKSHPGRISRMERDLSNTQDRVTPTEEGEDSRMFRRAAGKVPHVCIVGAGVAGLRCADVLLQHGAKVTIIEGRDRVGGRLCQDKVHGNMVDLILEYPWTWLITSHVTRGPNWIHGTDSNPILDLAKETRTLTMSWDGRQAVFDQHGNPLSDEEAAEATEIVWDTIEEAMKYSNDHSASIPAEKSLYEYFEEKVQQLFPDSQPDDKEAQRKRTRILQKAEMWGAFVGSPVQTQSLKFFWLEECIDGENLFVAETYQKVLEKIAAPALTSTDTRFKSKVTRILSNVNADEPRVTLETESGDKASFDEVVVTAPLGWLKRHRDAFVPQIPKRLEQAIESIGYGHLDKVYITFPTAFWNDLSDPKPQIIPKRSSTHNVTATTEPLHQDATSTVNPNHWPGFTHWSSPRYAPSTNPAHWNQECVNLAALPSSTAHPTLLFYTYGPTSLCIASLLSKYASPSDPEAQKVLTDFFMPYFSRLPNYSSADPSRQPIEILATVWANDELAGYGSYANFQTGLERGDEDVEVMRRGMPDRGVWLAGEHTAPFVALGTVTGAYWAGEGVAKRIAGLYGLDKQEEAVTRE